jgi:glutamate formiminotransferase/formiminotetrahydrofolate cyclodeaminase
VIRLVECVPNFSEGRDRSVYGRIAAEAETVEGVRLLDVDPGAATNRTVVTFAGPPDAVVEAAFRCIAKAAELIDMSRHSGEHPRLGATDVCPFVPLSGVTMEECAELARRLGRRVGEELRIPVYLYEEAASRPERRSLADIRQGEYEGLGQKLKDPAWKPDFGPAAFDARSGATVIGAREFLIAYNVTLNTREKKLAQEIALNIREAGRAAKGRDGAILRDEKGETVKVPGTLKSVRATGWFIEEYRRAQVSINLTNFRVTSPHAAFEEVCAQAAKLGLRVTGSEVVGLVPLEAVLMAGRYYRERQGRSPAAPERDLIEMAVHSLGLNDVSPFDPAKKIIENRFREASAGFAGRTLAAFLDDVSDESPAPGGGSVAALCGAAAASLAAMVAGVTYPRAGSEERRPALAEIGSRAHALKEKLLAAVQEDSGAFDAVLAARRLKAATPEEKAAKESAIQTAVLGAIEVPLSVVRASSEVLRVAGEVAEIGAASALSDVGVAALAAAAAAEGAFDNVLINLPELRDTARASSIRREAEGLLAGAKSAAAALRARIDRGLRAAGAASA